jgi:putative flippase GtrA
MKECLEILMTQSNLSEVSVAADVYEQPLVVLEPDGEDVQPAKSLRTYRPTPWALVNRILDIVDSITGGRAGQMQRFFSFVFIGGIASLVNLGVLYVVYYHTRMSVSPHVHYILAFALASEISILANFIPNDYFTFRHLPGHKRSWGARCLRFHITSISGTALTFLINFALSYGLHISPVLAQAVALIIVLFYNFTVHHLFTYRHIKTAPAH